MKDDFPTEGAPVADPSSLSKNLATTGGALQAVQSTAQLAGVSSSALNMAGQAVNLAQSASSVDASVSNMLGAAQSAAGLASALGATSPAVQAASKAVSLMEAATPWDWPSKGPAQPYPPIGPMAYHGGPGLTAPDLNQRISPRALAPKDAPSDFDDRRRMFRLYSKLPEDKRLFVHTLEGHEALNEIYEFRVELVARSSTIELKELMSKPLAVGIRQTDGSERILSGYVREFKLVRNNVKGWAVYAATLVPWTHILTMNQDSRCLRDKTVRQVIEEVFQPYGSSASYEFRFLNIDDEVQDFIVQYQQSDWDFVSYLVEREGWAMFYEQGLDGQKLVITDDTVSSWRCPPLPVYPTIEFNGGDRMLPHNRVNELHAVRELQPTQFTLDTFDYKAPRSPRQTQWPTRAQQGEVPSVEVFDGTPGYAFKNRKEGDRYASLRIEEREARAKRFEGRSDCPDLRPGGTTVLTSHPQFTSRNERLLIIRVEHRGRNDVFGDAEEGPTGYANTFHCMRQKVPYRPPLRTPRATIPGTQTAIVTGPPGHEIWTNQDGCIKVRFHWDRRAKFDSASSGWIRVGQGLAGGSWGSVSIPRVGHEVLVGFMDGDPARPIVLASLYNSDQRPPYPLPASGHMMGVKSNSTPGGHGYSEMVIHDEKGSELVNLRSQKDLTFTALNDHATQIGHDQNTLVGNNQTTAVKQHLVVQSLEADITVLAKTQVTIACGAASIMLAQDGTIVLNGKHVIVNGSEAIDLNAGTAAAPTAPAANAKAGGGGAGTAGAQAASGAASSAAPHHQKNLVKMNLGDKVDDLLNKSPTLQKDYKTLKDRGWKIEYGAAGGGTYADRTTKTVTVDISEKDNPNDMVQSLSHEFGHAMYPYKDDYSSKTAYVNGALADEGAATMNNIKAQREILSSGGPDIGIAGNTGNQPAYNKAYDQFLKDGQAAKARATIGAIYGNGEKTSTTNQPYAQYYGSAYDSH